MKRTPVGKGILEYNGIEVNVPIYWEPVKTHKSYAIFYGFKKKINVNVNMFNVSYKCLINKKRQRIITTIQPIDNKT